MNSDAKSGVGIAHLSAPCQRLVESVQQRSGAVEENGPFVGESVARFPIDERKAHVAFERSNMGCLALIGR